MMRESDKHFLISMFAATGIIMFWKGIWEGVGSLPLLENPWVSLFVGAVILTFSGIILKEFDPLGGLEKSVMKAISSVHTSPKKKEYTIKYYDKKQKKTRELSAENLKKVEKNVIILHVKGKEQFIPVHRIRSIHRKGKTVWKT